MSTTWIADYQKDPTRYFRERFAAVSAQNEREVEQSRRTNEQLKSYAAWAKRREPDTSGPGRAA